MDRAVSHAISIFARSSPATKYMTKYSFFADVSTFPSFYNHFEAERHSDRDKPYKDNLHVISGSAP